MTTGFTGDVVQISVGMEMTVALRAIDDCNTDGSIDANRSASPAIHAAKYPVLRLTIMPVF